MGIIKRHRNLIKFQTKDEINKRKRIIKYIKVAIISFATVFIGVFLATVIINLIIAYLVQGIRW